MSSPSIIPYFPFCQVHFFGQRVTEEGSTLRVRPDKRYKPVCSVCSRHCAIIHAWVKRPIRDLNCGDVKVIIHNNKRG